MKKKISILLTVVFVLSTLTPVSGAISFSDINDVPWEGAKTYITSVADLGLMVGDYNSAGQRVFRSRDKISYSEATQLIYAILQKSGKVDSSVDLVTKWKSVMSGNNIMEWAYPAVAYALENNALTINDLPHFMANATTHNYASREDVSVIFGKSLSRFYSINASATLSFGDKSKVSSTSVPYVALLAEHEILVGDDNNNFNPWEYINRAQMAVVASKSYHVLTDGTIQGTDATSMTGIVTGIVDGSSSTMITVTAGATKKGFIADASTKVVYKTQTASVSDITVGDTVTVDYSGSKVSKITFVASSVYDGSFTVSGVIDDITSSRLYITRDDTGKSDNYYFSVAALVTLDGKSSSIKDVITAFEDDSVSVELNVNKDYEITKMVATRYYGKEITGEITGISSSSVSILLSSGNRVTHNILSGAKIYLEDSLNSIVNINNMLRSQDLYAKVYLNDTGDVIRLYAYTSNPDAETSVYGIIYSVSSASGIKIQKPDGTITKAYDYASSLGITIDGSRSKITDLVTEYDTAQRNSEELYVTVALNESGEVKTITALTEYEFDTTGDIYGTISALTSKRITVTTGAGKSEMYYFTTSTSDILVRIDEKIADFDDLLTAFSDNGAGGIDVTLGLSSAGTVNKIVAVTSISSANTVKGNISMLRPTYIKIKGKSDTYYINNVSTLEVYVTDGGVSAQRMDDYYELKDGVDNGRTMYVTLTLKNGYVTKVSGEVTEVSGTLDSIRKSNYSIIVLNNDGTSSTYYYKDEADLYITLNGSSRTLSDIIQDLRSYDISVELILDGGYVTDIIASRN